MKTTAYFEAMLKRPDRAVIRREWIRRVVSAPLHEHVKADVRRWAAIPEAEGRFLRVILLPDGKTVHNAFFDRGFEP